jgi:hypothetical protein
VATATLFGLGAIGQLAALIGIAGGLKRPVIIGGAALIVAVGWPLWRALRIRPTWRWLLAALIAAILAILVGEVLWPTSKFDGAGYHIPVAQAIARSGHIDVTPWLRFPMMPRHSETLFAIALLFGDDIDVQLIEALFFALTALQRPSSQRR